MCQEYDVLNIYDIYKKCYQNLTDINKVGIYEKKKSKLLIIKNFNVNLRNVIPLRIQNFKFNLQKLLYESYILNLRNRNYYK